MPHQGQYEDSTFSERFAKSPNYSRILGMICFILAVVVFFTSISLFAFTGRVVPFDYGIIIDAGSTHTQAYLYRWLGNKDSGTGKVSQEDTCYFDSGIASVKDPTVILQCVNDVINSIPNSMQLQTPLYLGATAGMRLLNITDPEEANLRLLTLKYSLLTTSVNVKDVSIISGRDEGLYSWITVNFLANTLNPRTAIHSLNETYGALDLGGASTQFSYALSSSESKADEITHLKLYGIEYNVFAKSFLCFGAEQAHTRYLTSLINISNFNKSENIVDPCLPKGNYTTLSAKFLLGGPCTSTPLFEGWLQNFSPDREEFWVLWNTEFIPPLNGAAK